VSGVEGEMECHVGKNFPQLPLTSRITIINAFAIRLKNTREMKGYEIWCRGGD